MTAGGVLLCQTEAEGDAVVAPQVTAPAAGGKGSYCIPDPPAHPATGPHLLTSCCEIYLCLPRALLVRGRPRGLV